MKITARTLCCVKNTHAEYANFFLQGDLAISMSPAESSEQHNTVQNEFFNGRLGFDDIEGDRHIHFCKLRLHRLRETLHFGAENFRRQAWSLRPSLFPSPPKSLSNAVQNGFFNGLPDGTPAPA